MTISKKEIQKHVDSHTDGMRAQLLSRTELRLIVSHQVERVLGALREEREESLELYGAPDIENALEELDAVDKELGEALELAGEGPGLLDESWNELLQRLTVVWATSRRIRRSLQPNSSKYVPGLSDDSEPLTTGQEAAQQAVGVQ